MASLVVFPVRNKDEERQYESHRESEESLQSKIVTLIEPLTNESGRTFALWKKVQGREKSRRSAFDVITRPTLGMELPVYR